MSGDPLAQYFPFFLKGKSPMWAMELLEFYASSSNIFKPFKSECFPPWMTWIMFYQGKPFSQTEAEAIFWHPMKFNGRIVIPSMGDSFCARLYLLFTAAFLYMYISRQRENRNPCICELLHMIPCINKQLNSLFLWWVFIPDFPPFPPLQREQTESMHPFL